MSTDEGYTAPKKPRIKLTFNFGPEIGDIEDYWIEEGRLIGRAHITDPEALKRFINDEYQRRIGLSGKFDEPIRDHFEGEICFSIPMHEFTESDAILKVKAPCPRCNKEGWVTIMKDGVYLKEGRDCEECSKDGGDRTKVPNL